MLLNDDTQQFHKKTTPNTPQLNVSIRYRLPLLHTLVIVMERKKIESSASPDPSISEDLISETKMSVKKRQQNIVKNTKQQ